MLERDVLLWLAITTILETKKGRVILIRASDAAEIYCITLATDDILKEDGASKVLTHLQTGFGETDSMKLSNLIYDWLDFVRTDEIMKAAFLCGYQTRIDLRQGLFDSTTKGLIIASAGGSSEIGKLSATLKVLFPEGAVIPAPIAAASFNSTPASCPTSRGGMFCDHCNRLNHTKADIRAFMRANGQMERAIEFEAEALERSAARRNGARNGKIGPSAFSNKDDSVKFYMSSDSRARRTANPAKYLTPEPFGR